MSRFSKATRKKAKLRLALDGPSGSGKSFTGLRFAFALAAHTGLRVAAIDTEHGSLSKYKGEAPDGIPFDFEVAELTQFAPTEYTSAIHDAVREGFGILFIDSLSHAWTGEGGALELKDKTGGNSFTAWKNITPMHNRMIEAIISAPMHILVSMRSKTEYVIEKDGEGKSIPRKVGLAPIQRAGMEYEFDVYGSMDHSHILTVSKSRCSAIQDAICPKPGASFMAPLISWLETGDAGELPEGTIKRQYASDEIVKRLTVTSLESEQPREKIVTNLRKTYGVDSFELLTESQATELLTRMTGEIERKRKRTSGTTVGATGASPAANGTKSNGADTSPLPSTAAPQVSASQVLGPTDEQIETLVGLRSLMMAAKGIPNDNEAGQQAAWVALLRTGFPGVESVREIPRESIPDLIEALRQEYDLPLGERGARTESVPQGSETAEPAAA